MAGVFSSFIPIWVLAAGGYLAGRFGLLGERADAVLSRFVFLLGMPAALFSTLSRTPVAALANSWILAFAGSTLLAGLAGAAASRWLFRRRLADQAIGGMVSGYVNAGNLGIPVAVQVLGDASFVLPALLFQLLCVSPIVLTLIDLDRADGRGYRLRDALMLPVRTPVIGASVAGVLCSLAGLQLPAGLTRSLELLGSAAVPAALLALGMSLCGRSASTGRERAEVWLAVLLKVIVQPLAAFLLARFVLGLEGPVLLAAVLFSALPTAQNAFVFATQFGLRTALARDAVLFSTLLSMGTLSVIALLLV